MVGDQPRFQCGASAKKTNLALIYGYASIRKGASNRVDMVFRDKCIDKSYNMP